jgi:hypothetical protein
MTSVGLGSLMIVAMLFATPGLEPISWSTPI